ncbi:MAG TPA: hypothetical protein VKP03_02475 [Patescibacteria group bacterium]|nr:hypothetical protein [Patescibacteria group bacterium]
MGESPLRMKKMIYVALFFLLFGAGLICLMYWLLTRFPPYVSLIVVAAYGYLFLMYTAVHDYLTQTDESNKTATMFLFLVVTVVGLLGAFSFLVFD